MILQIINDNPIDISANWVIAALLAITIFLLKRILDRFEKKLEEHSNRITDAETDIAVIKSKLE